MSNGTEFIRAQTTIEAALRDAENDGADLYTTAASLLAFSAGAYGALYGQDGPNGLPQALDRLSASYAAHGAKHEAKATYGTIGRA